MELTDILKAITVDCKDNQHQFTVRNRIDRVPERKMPFYNRE